MYQNAWIRNLEYLVRSTLSAVQSVSRDQQEAPRLS